jgi:PRC-barrel domain
VLAANVTSSGSFTIRNGGPAGSRANLRRMLRSLADLRGYALLATDGEVGTVADFLVDDATWAVRYLVADTGTWREDHQTLVSPIAVRGVDWDLRAIAVGLTREEIERSPPLERHLPVSRQFEQDLYQYYGWPYYWGGVGAWGTVLTPAALAMEPPPAPEDAGEAADAEPPEDPHLHSVREVTGYHVQARDDEVGHVEDLIVDDETWTVRYLIVDTRNWLPGRKVLIPPSWVERFSWSERLAVAGVTRAEIEGAPEFDPAAPVNRRYETQLYDYYGRPAYWDE